MDGGMLPRMRQERETGGNFDVTDVFVIFIFDLFKCGVCQRRDRRDLDQ